MARTALTARSAATIAACLAAAVPLLAPLRADTRLWTGIVWLSFCAATWGLVKARRSARYVRDARRRWPHGDYSSARLSATNHLVTHWVLWAVQADLLAFSVFLGTQPPAPRAGGVTPTQVAFTLALLALELALGGLNTWLVVRRAMLVRNVQRIGGD